MLNCEQPRANQRPDYAGDLTGIVGQLTRVDLVRWDPRDMIFFSFLFVSLRTLFFNFSQDTFYRYAKMKGMDMSSHGGGGGSGSSVPWLDQPVMLHSSRADTCEMTPEQCVYRAGHWRYW